MTAYDCIFVNGDSYSAPNFKIKVYADWLAEILKIPVINVAVPGSNNQRITRSTVEHLNTTLNIYKNPLVIIGWSFLRRREVWYYGADNSVSTDIPDCILPKDDPINPRLITLDFLLKSNKATLEQKMLVDSDLHIHKLLADFYTNIFLIEQHLDNLNLDYIMFSAADNTDSRLSDYPYQSGLYQTRAVENNNKIWPLHDFCIKKFAQANDPDHTETYHLSESGHNKFAIMLVDYLKNRQKDNIFI
jgi:hypothetical protein